MFCRNTIFFKIYQEPVLPVFPLLSTATGFPTPCAPEPPSLSASFFLLSWSFPRSLSKTIIPWPTVTHHILPVHIINILNQLIPDVQHGSRRRDGKRYLPFTRDEPDQPLPGLHEQSIPSGNGLKNLSLTSPPHSCTGKE